MQNQKNEVNNIKNIPELVSGSSTHAVSCPPVRRDGLQGCKGVSNKADALKGFLFRAYHVCRCQIKSHPRRPLSGISSFFSLLPWREKVGAARMRGNQQAFTLIELLVVVLIIGILAAVAVPQYQKSAEKSRVMQIITFGKNIIDAQQAFYLENNRYATSLDELSIDIPGKTSENGSKKIGLFSLRASCTTGPNCVFYSQRLVNHDNTNSYYQIYCDGSCAETHVLNCQLGNTEDPYHICETLSHGIQVGTRYIIQ